MRDYTETWLPRAGQGEFQLLWHVEDELRKRGFSIGPCQGSDPRGIMPAEYDVAKWRNLSKRERAELSGVMTFVGRPRAPERIIVTWSTKAVAHG
jgi:hypothetical protein